MVVLDDFGYLRNAPLQLERESRERESEGVMVPAFPQRTGQSSGQSFSSPNYFFIIFLARCPPKSKGASAPHSQSGQTTALSLYFLSLSLYFLSPLGFPLPQGRLSKIHPVPTRPPPFESTGDVTFRSSEESIREGAIPADPDLLPVMRSIPAELNAPIGRDYAIRPESGRRRRRRTAGRPAGSGFLSPPSFLRSFNGEKP